MSTKAELQRTLGDLLRSARGTSRLKDVADSTGVPASDISRWERGKALPREANLARYFPAIQSALEKNGRFWDFLELAGKLRIGTSQLLAAPAYESDLHATLQSLGLGGPPTPVKVQGQLQILHLYSFKGDGAAVDLHCTELAREIEESDAFQDGERHAKLSAVLLEQTFARIQHLPADRFDSALRALLRARTHAEHETVEVEQGDELIHWSEFLFTIMLRMAREDLDRSNEDERESVIELLKRQRLEWFDEDHPLDLAMETSSPADRVWVRLEMVKRYMKREMWGVAEKYLADLYSELGRLGAGTTRLLVSTLAPEAHARGLIRVFGESSEAQYLIDRANLNDINVKTVRYMTDLTQCELLLHSKKSSAVADGKALLHTLRATPIPPHQIRKAQRLAMLY